MEGKKIITFFFSVCKKKKKRKKNQAVADQNGNSCVLCCVGRSIYKFWTDLVESGYTAYRGSRTRFYAYRSSLVVYEVLFWCFLHNSFASYSNICDINGSGAVSSLLKSYIEVYWRFTKINAGCTVLNVACYCPRVTCMIKYLIQLKVVISGKYKNLNKITKI